jgi:hypothetical protein
MFQMVSERLVWVNRYRVELAAVPAVFATPAKAEASPLL